MEITGCRRRRVANMSPDRSRSFADVWAVLGLPAAADVQPGGDSDDPSNPILANYGDNSLKVRLRAHPDVAAANHGDLLAAGTWSAPAG